MRQIGLKNSEIKYPPLPLKCSGNRIRKSASNCPEILPEQFQPKHLPSIFYNPDFAMHAKFVLRTNHSLAWNHLQKICSWMRNTKPIKAVALFLFQLRQVRWGSVFMDLIVLPRRLKLRKEHGFCRQPVATRLGNTMGLSEKRYAST